MPPVLSKITRANHDGSVKSTDNFYEASLDPDLAYIISNVVSNIKSNPLQTKRRAKRRIKHPCSVCSKNVCDNQRAITTLSAEKRVRNYSEFTRKCVAKKTGP